MSTLEGFVLKAGISIGARFCLAIGGKFFDKLSKMRRFLKACRDIEEEMLQHMDKLEIEYSKVIYNHRLPAGMEIERKFVIPPPPPSFVVFEKYYIDVFERLPLESRAAFEAIREKILKIKSFKGNSSSLIEKGDWGGYEHSFGQFILDYMYICFFVGKFSRSRGANVMVVQSPSRFNKFLLHTYRISLDKNELFRKYLESKGKTVLSQEDSLKFIQRLAREVKNNE